MKRLLIAAMTVSALFLGSALARADFRYDTTGSWDGSNSNGSFGAGNSNTATIGETFVGPSGAGGVPLTLTDFSFHIQPSDGVHLQFAAYVYAWTGALTGHGGHATGSALYTSPTMTLDGDGTFKTLAFQGFRVDTTPGTSYVAFLTVSNINDYNASTNNGTTAYGLVALPHPAGNGGGGFVFDGNGSNFASLTTTAWTTFTDQFGDLAWTADFVPEPSSLVLSLVAGGTLGIVAIRGRRRGR